MSELTDRIRANLDGEWRTTAEIADASGIPGMRSEAVKRTYRVLLAEHRKGYAERRAEESERGGKRTYWRRTP